MPHIPRNIQSPNTEASFWARWRSVNPRMALFVKVSKTIGETVLVRAFTSNTRDMTLPGHPDVTFRSAVGITPSSIQSAINATTTLELQGLYQTGIFDRDDIINGKWDFAEIEIFTAAWDNVNLGELVLFRGNLGEIKDFGVYFNAEGKGLIGRLSSDPAKVSSRNCRVKQFRDSECGFTGNTVTIGEDEYSLTLTSSTARLEGDRNLITIVDALASVTPSPSGNPIPPTDFFNNGVLLFDNGTNEGISREILKYTYDPIDDVIFIAVKRAFPLEDTSINSLDVTITAGCNRTVEDCRKYGNILNFRGEPYVPGFEAMNRIPTSS